MNDFTKEELEMIRDDLDFHMKTYRSYNLEFARHLRRKIQSIIDKYSDESIKEGNKNVVDYAKKFCEQNEDLLNTDRDRT